MSKQVDWNAIRADYESGVSFRVLAKNYDVSKSYIIEKRNKDNWNRPLQNRPTTADSGPRTRDIDAATRVQTAIKIFLEEHPGWDEIAARAGYASRGAAHSAVMREMERCITHDVQELRTQELYRIEQVQTRAYKEATDKANKDWQWAADRFNTLSKRKSELMGLDKRPDEELANQNYIKKVVLTHSDGEQNVSS